MYLFRMIATAYLCVFSMSMVSAADKPVEKPSPLALMCQISKGLQAHENSKRSFFQRGLDWVRDTVASPQLNDKDRIVISQEILRGTDWPVLAISVFVKNDQTTVLTNSEKALWYRQLLALSDGTPQQILDHGGVVRQAYRDNYTAGSRYNATVPVTFYANFAGVSSQPQVVEPKSPTATIIELATEPTTLVGMGPLNSTATIDQDTPYTEEPDIVRIRSSIEHRKLRPLSDDRAWLTKKLGQDYDIDPIILKQARDVVRESIVTPFMRKENKPLMEDHYPVGTPAEHIVLDDFTRCKRRMKIPNPEDLVVEFYDTIDCTTTISRAAMNEYLKKLGK